MAGGVSLPRPIHRDTIRRDGRRRGYTGDDLEDFVRILIGIDDVFVEVQTRLVAADAKKAADSAKKNRR